MENVNEINLPILEFQDINELNAEELEAIAGGGWWDDTWNAVNEGYRDLSQGLSDGLNGKNVSESNNNYGTGHVLGSLWRTKF
ncbi:hypothetical protein IQ268_30915 [Oculatella sp. LEGE 06141]|uniref:hypothetical protein n=1 Tax=Oculatella sp. LEGE 06141 TaxID=1828648 RepID=UPI00187E5214|nr:hypothetical protein [Oculatella sp. LEGE 06141]MBE9182950.1 hypothetical protein [Oculatella sp. LEGE 06141]